MMKYSYMILIFINSDENDILYKDIIENNINANSKYICSKNKILDNESDNSSNQ